MAIVKDVLNSLRSNNASPKRSAWCPHLGIPCWKPHGGIGGCSFIQIGDDPSILFRRLSDSINGTGRAVTHSAANSNGVAANFMIYENGETEKGSMLGYTTSRNGGAGSRRISSLLYPFTTTS
jgi:hypothetical protein